MFKDEAGGFMSVVEKVGWFEYWVWRIKRWFFMNAIEDVRSKSL